MNPYTQVFKQLVMVTAFGGAWYYVTQNQLHQDLPAEMKNIPSLEERREGIKK